MEKLTGRVVDFRKCGWGHNISVLNNQNRCAVHCTPRLEEGDEILTEEGRFVAWAVRACGDPADMVICNFMRTGQA